MSNPRAVGRKPKLRRATEIIWLYYSGVSCLFLIGLIIDLLHIWSAAYSQGVTLYVNHFGEGNTEMIIFVSTAHGL